MKCKVCHYRIRGAYHKDGEHHKRAAVKLDKETRKRLEKESGLPVEEEEKDND